MDDQVLQVLQRMSDKQDLMLTDLVELKINMKHQGKEIDEVTIEIDTVKAELKEVSKVPENFWRNLWVGIVGGVSFLSVVINILFKIKG